uniref:Reverse transcriptase domain-containing protein n=1 Tax=Tanacetum cinerariifolium TaxID=118510 RepID=A0A699QMY9_TANCI|nr:reverse transcriptase domain-containing protein [Tanacetum cinerariifolium]
MTPAMTSVLGFIEEISWPLGQISLMVSLGDEEYSRRAMIDFMIVRSPSTYNGIIGRPRLKKVQAVPSTTHEMLKNQDSNSTRVSRTNYHHRRKSIREKKDGTLQSNLDIFAWKSADMTGVLRSIAEHRLNVREGCPQ